MKNKVEVFYTGGGIWIAEMDLNDKEYAVITSEMIDVLGVYKKVDEDDEKYYPEDMILDQHKDELDDNFKKIYDVLITELVKKL